MKDNRCKLTTEQVKQIKEENGKRSIRSVAKDYKVSSSSIFKIWHGLVWKKVKI